MYDFQSDLQYENPYNVVKVDYKKNVDKVDYTGATAPKNGFRRGWLAVTLPRYRANIFGFGKLVEGYLSVLC